MPTLTIKQRVNDVMDTLRGKDTERASDSFDVLVAQIVVETLTQTEDRKAFLFSSEMTLDILGGTKNV